MACRVAQCLSALRSAAVSGVIGGSVQGVKPVLYKTPKSIIFSLAIVDNSTGSLKVPGLSGEKAFFEDLCSPKPRARVPSPTYAVLPYFP